jgi:hypothetical protein
MLGSSITTMIAANDMITQASTSPKMLFHPNLNFIEVLTVKFWGKN